MTATNPQTTSTASSSEKKPNVFQRMWQKLDASMKQKAEASSSSCCCSDDEKSDKKAGNKCC